uniref:Putative methyltransferase n=1 Tax=viral metagenome TaxID=1070528 RepID=A0A6M3XVT8_9ZZZZ
MGTGANTGQVVTGVASCCPPVVLSLCDYTGEWPKPYEDAGYTVIRVELTEGQDVRLLRADTLPPIHGILAAPPCTHFSSSGACWWKGKGDGALLEGLSVVDACVRLIVALKPMWWCLENPVGRLIHYLGPWRMTFNPCDYGDPYTKRTCLWGDFNTELPENPVAPAAKSRIHHMSPGPDRGRLRSVTPPGFARAFFEVNP